MSNVQFEKAGGDDVSSVIVDIGSHTTRIGYGQEDCPRQWWNSICGKPLYYTDDNVGQKLVFPVDFTAPKESMEVKSLLTTQGSRHILDPEAFEIILSSCVEGTPKYSYLDELHNISSTTDHMPRKFGGLGVKIDQHPFLLSEPSKQYMPFRETICEIMYEKFQAPACYLGKQAMLSAFAMGRSTALVVDIGASGTTITPVIDGYTLQKNILHFSAGGDLLDSHIYHTLSHQDKISFSPFYGKKINAYYPLKTNMKVDISSEESRIHHSFFRYSQMEAIKNLKETICRVRTKCTSKDKPNDKTPEKSSNSNNHLPETSHKDDSPCQFELPDGQIINAQKYKYDVAELLFSSELIENNIRDPLLRDFKGLTPAIVQCILKCDVDLRKDLLNSIILTGGISFLPGLVERVNYELHEHSSLSNSSLKFKVLAPNSSIERRFGVWLGGSILASLGTFQQLWVSQKEYDEYGIGIINKRCS